MKTKSWKCSYSRKNSILILSYHNLDKYLICNHFKNIQNFKHNVMFWIWNDWVSVNTKITTWQSMTKKKTPLKYQIGVRLKRPLWINPIIFLFERFYNRDKIKRWKTWLCCRITPAKSPPSPPKEIITRTDRLSNFQLN